MAEAKTTKKKVTKEQTDGAIQKSVKVAPKTVVEDKEVTTPAANSTEQKINVEEKTMAKAGKRSAKALKEVEDKQAKEERKAVDSAEETDAKPKKAIKPTRSRLERRSKKFREATKLIEHGKEYSLKEALELATKTNTAKFDATVELHINLGVDPRQADQNIRGTVSLPAGTGKHLRVAVFADIEDAKKAKAAGADVAGSDDFLQQLDKGEINFDVLIATPMMMAKLGKYARTLGPKGLMPNPKSGTVTTDVAKAVKEAKAGKVEYRVDSTGIVHLRVGKTSFTSAQLLENTQTVLASIKAAKPASIKGTYCKAIHLSSTMGPSITVALSEF